MSSPFSNPAVGELCPTCGQVVTAPAEWWWAVRAGGVSSYWRGEGALDQAYAAAERRLDRWPDERVTILLSTSSGLSYGVADRREPDGEWVVGPDRWRTNYENARADGRAA